MNDRVTAIVTAYKRIDQTLFTLSKLEACTPPPAQILVHIDGNETKTQDAILQRFPNICCILSFNSMGPGGGRNKLLAAATHELVASFDDDSFPVDADYFARVIQVSERAPAAAIIVAEVTHAGEAIREASETAEWVSDFIGCGCVYRKSVFMQTTGYVPLPTAYGMEEVDLALRMHAVGKRILKTNWLRIFHDTDLKRHDDPEVTAGSIANIALLTFLRYPMVLWPVGLYQMARRVSWLLTHGRSRGVLRGLGRIPSVLWKNRLHRQRLSVASVKSYLKLRRRPLSCQWPEELPKEGGGFLPGAE